VGASGATEPPLYFGLTRCSTKVQAEEGHTLAAQDTRLQEEAAQRGWRLELIPVPAVSGSKLSPELCLVLERLSLGEAAGLVVTKLDRLTRSVQIAAGIIKAADAQGWNLVMLDLGLELSTPGGKAMAHMLATFAEFERDMIVARTRAGLNEAKRNGTKSGKPIGRPREVAQAVADQIYLLRDRDGKTFAAIAEHLTEAGEPTPRGSQTWQPSTVRRIYNAAPPPVRTVD
jgi:DNA invertase Pin-like site-specific DNA recombinase